MEQREVGAESQSRGQKPIVAQGRVSEPLGCRLSSKGVRMLSCSGDGCCPDLACRGERPSSLKGQLCVEGDGGEGEILVISKKISMLES